MTSMLSKMRTYCISPQCWPVALVTVLAASPLRAAPVAAPAMPAADSIRFSSNGVRLPGPQLQYNAAFDLMDFNGDGKLDLFMPNTAMMMFNVHLNEGT